MAGESYAMKLIVNMIMIEFNLLFDRKWNGCKDKINVPLYAPQLL